MSPTDMKRVSEFLVWNQELYRMPLRTPAPNGVLDPRLGIADKQSTCKTCNKKVRTRERGRVNSVHKSLFSSPLVHYKTSDVLTLTSPNAPDER